ncbi:MAG: iron-containing alcohol dehydrogenase [Clostridia bacterium]|nr:iron-containing alcohol dehydrogenase [Clostridia bacterium]
MLKFFMPTKIYVGKDCVLENAGELMLGKKAFIVTGKSSGEKSGALGDVIKALKKEKIPYYVYDKIENNPEIGDMAKGGEIAREQGCDFIIGIGGGSPLDASRAIAVYATNKDMELYDIFKGEYKSKPLPMVAVPTTVGTGSEVTPYSILTLHKEKTKKSFSCPDCFFKTAFLDGKYILKLPLQVVRNTVVDAMCHLIEGFTNKKASPLTDYIALEGLKIIGRHKGEIEVGWLSEGACTELLRSSCLGGIVISQTGTTIVHSMGYGLTYFKDIPHGMANGLLLYEYLKRVDKARVTDCLSALGFDSLEGLKDYLKKILPISHSFTDEEIYKFSEISIKARNVASCPFPVTQDIEIEMYKKSLQ